MGIMDVLKLFAGLGLFLFGMNIMSEGLEKAAGKQLKNMLGVVTKNRFLQVVVGFVITVLMQSSSATTVMLVGFVNAGIMQLTQAVGVIMGANIGTTVTALMLSVDIGFEIIFCFCGLILLFLPSKRFKGAKQFVPVVIGLGILFIGMEYMSSAMVPLRSSQVFKDAIQNVSNPILGVLIGAGITALLQSSAASIGILQALAGAGLIPFQTCIFILFGQNIGTCVTAVIACVGTNATAKRTAMVHLLFNVIGTVIFVIIACILPLADWITMLAPGNPADPANVQNMIKLWIALTHIVFNLITTAMLLPFASTLEKMACSLIPADSGTGEAMRLIHFDSRLLKTPAVAAEQLFNEVQRMGGIALANFRSAMACFEQWDEEKAAELTRNEDVLDFLNKEITTFLVEVKGLDLDEQDTLLVGSLFHVVNDMERVGDHAQNILEAAQLRQQEDVKFSEKAVQELEELSTLVTTQLERALELFRTRITAGPEITEVEEREEEIDNITEALRQHHVDRLKAHKCSAKNGMIYLDILTNLERIGDHAENIATSVDKVLPSHA